MLREEKHVLDVIRTGRNPQTGETVKIAARTVPTFKAGNKLKDALN